MKKCLNLKLNNAISFLEENEYEVFLDKASLAYDQVINKTGKGNDFLGWYDLQTQDRKEEVNRINNLANKIKENSDVLVVIGVGGSYLGTKASIEMLGGYFDKPKCEVLFAGFNLSTQYLSELINHLKDKDFSINVISKSGTTTEPAIAFRILSNLLYEKYGDNAKERIFVTTDKETGALRQIANENRYVSFDIPSNVGGRYSVLTAVGLLPLAVLGYNIEEILEGAKASYNEFVNTKDNDALKYATIRNALYNKGYNIEVLANYEPKLNYIGEWWSQLFGESEGKENLGIFPTTLSYTKDLHALGQMIQEGERRFIETLLIVKEENNLLTIDEDLKNLDNLNYLKGKSIKEVNQKTMEGAINAHVSGGVPNILLELEDVNEYSLGYLIFFFFISCTLSAYILGVNPFNQPGVEAYKKNMFKLLNKPGF